MENNKNKKSVKFQGDMLNFCDFIQVFVFTRNHHLKSVSSVPTASMFGFVEKSELKIVTVKFLRIGANRSEQTVETQTNLLLKEHSDQGLFCLPFAVHPIFKNTIIL